MELSDLIGIVEIFVTLVVGFWLTHFYSVRDTRSRALKDFYIDQTKGLVEDVRHFFARLLSGRVTGQELTGWHKSHKSKFKAYDEGVRHSFPIECEKVTEALFSIHKDITELEEFNNGYADGNFNFSVQTRKMINDFEGSALALLNDYVVEINNSAGMNPFVRTYRGIQHEWCYYKTTDRRFLSYLLLWLWRIAKVLLVLLAFYYIANLANGYYKEYKSDKDKEKVLMQQKIDKAINATIVIGEKLDSLDNDLKLIKDNMRVRKGVNNYWIHTSCSDNSKQLH